MPTGDDETDVASVTLVSVSDPQADTSRRLAVRFIN